MEHIEHEIIEKLWPEKEFELYINDFYKKHKHSYRSYKFLLYEELFAALVTSLMLQNTKKTNKRLEETRKCLDRGLPLQTAIKASKSARDIVSKGVVFVAVLAIAGITSAAVDTFRDIRLKKRRKLFANISAFLILTKELPNKSINNYERWRDYSKTRGKIIPLLTLSSKLIPRITDFSSYNNHIDFITLIYSAYYYLYDDKTSKFSDFIFDIIRSENSKLNDGLYTYLCTSPHRYAIHTEYQDYCVSKGIEEKSLFIMDDSVFNSNNNNKDKIPNYENQSKITKDEYFPNLSLNDNKIRKLYNILVDEEFIMKDTNYAVFHFRLSGKDKPKELKEIIWIKDKKELSYLIYRLTRTDISDERCIESGTTRDFNRKTKIFFKLDKENWKKDNISDMAKKASIPNQEKISKLLNEVSEQTITI